MNTVCGFVKRTAPFVLLCTGLAAQTARIVQGPDFAMTIQKDGTIRCSAHFKAISPRPLDLKTGFGEARLDVEPRTVGPATFEATLTGFPPAAEAALDHAMSIWAPLLEASVPIRISAEFVALTPGNVANSGAGFLSDFPQAPLASTFYPAALANQFAGFDLVPGQGQFDITCRFNSSLANWYFGTDSNPGGGQIDFVSVALHEIAHGLGFVSSAGVDGANGTLGSQGVPLIYDRFLENEAGISLLTLPNPSAQMATAFTNGNLFFGGPSATASNGGTAPELFAPAVFDDGSSVSHLDEGQFPQGNSNALMTPTINQGEANHHPGNITLGLFGDLGWTVVTSSILHFAQFGNGSTLTSDVVVVNPSTLVTATGEIQFFDPEGNLLDPTPFLPGGTDFVLGPLGTRTFASNGLGNLVQGSATVSSDFSVGGVIRFTLGSFGVAGVGSSQPLTAAIAPVRRSGMLSTGVAIRNPGQDLINVQLTLKDEDGQVVAQGTVGRSIPAQGRVSEFIQEFFPDADTANFVGSICVEALSGQIAVIALELDTGPNPKFTTLPVTPID